MPTAPGYADCSIGISQVGTTRLAYLTFGLDPTLTDPLLIGADILNAWRAAGSMKSIMDASSTVTTIRVALGTDGGEDIVGVTTAAEVGGTTINTLPPNCAALFHKRTARGGRRGRGRWFVPWSVSDTNIDDAGVITPAHVIAMSTAANVFRTTIAAAGSPMVVLHGPGLTSPGVPDVVTSLQADGLISTQRRRLGR